MLPPGLVATVATLTRNGPNVKVSRKIDVNMSAVRSYACGISWRSTYVTNYEETPQFVSAQDTETWAPTNGKNLGIDTTAT